MRFLVLLAIICFSCQNNESQKNEILELKSQIETLKKQAEVTPIDETAFIHTVLVWFKDDVTEADKLKFANEGLSELMSCESIYKAYYGPPAGTPREVVDNSYGYAFVCHFKSAKDQDIYQEDPKHLDFIEKYKHLWERVQVYDNLVNK